MITDGENGKDELAELKRLVKNWRTFWLDNIESYHSSRNFIYFSNLEKREVDALEVLQKPPFTFNTLEAYLSRMKGEFGKQQPSFRVSVAPDAAQKVPPQITSTLEGHFLAIQEDTKRDSVEDKIYDDQLSGGYSVMHVYTDYESDYTFNMKIGIERSYDPTMCGFDPLAKLPSKSDGGYAFELCPIKTELFNELYPDVNVGKIGSQDLGGYKYNYTGEEEPIVLVCRMYRKKFKRKRLVYLANGKSMLKTDYKKMIANWASMEQAPVIKKERTVRCQSIEQILFYDKEIIEKKDTIFTELPLIFVDGNSSMLRKDGSNSDMKQHTRAYFYNAFGAQKLKNIAGQTLANELENTITHKFKTPKEAMPDDYMDGYTNMQQTTNVVYNAFLPDGITPIPSPEEIARPPIPAEISATFMGSDQVIQNILGSYDAQLGINGEQLSGVAIIEAATQNNASSMPYIMNFLAAWSQAAKVMLDIFPAVYFNARSIPVIDKLRKRSYQNINGYGEDSIPFNYQPNSLGVMVEAGVNFEVQKNRSVAVMTNLAKALPGFAEILNTEGLPILFDNLDFRGADALKDIADKKVKQKANQPPPPNPQMIKAQSDAQYQAGKLQVDQQNAQTDAKKVMLDYMLGLKDLSLDEKKANVEAFIDGHHAGIEKRQQDHNESMDVIDRHHQQKMDKIDKLHQHIDTGINALQSAQDRGQPHMPEGA